MNLGEQHKYFFNHSAYKQTPRDTTKCQSNTAPGVKLLLASSFEVTNALNRKLKQTLCHKRILSVSGVKNAREHEDRIKKKIELLNE